MRSGTTVRRWRKSGWQNASETTKKLLRHWWREDRTRRLFFCQLEAAETIVYLREILAAVRKPRWKPQLAPDEFRMLEAGRNPRPDEWVARVAQHPKLSDVPNEAGAASIPRYACKMATGAGKTVVMSMLIAWAFCNRGTKPGDPRYPRRVLVVCPNLTIMGTPERVAARRSGQLLREVRRRALLAAPRAGEGQGAGHELARPEPGTRPSSRWAGCRSASWGTKHRGVRPRPPRRSLGRRAADGAERRGTPCVSSRPGRREDEAVLRGKGGPRGSDGLGERPGPGSTPPAGSGSAWIFRRRPSTSTEADIPRAPPSPGSSATSVWWTPSNRGSPRSPPPGDRQHGPPRSRVLQAVGARGEASQAGGPVAGRQAEARGRLPRGGSRRCSRSRGSGRNASIRCSLGPRGRTGPRR